MAHWILKYEIVGIFNSLVHFPEYVRTSRMGCFSVGGIFLSWVLALVASSVLAISAFFDLHTVKLPLCSWSKKEVAFFFHSFLCWERKVRSSSPSWAPPTETTEWRAEIQTCVCIISTASVVVKGLLITQFVKTGLSSLGIHKKYAAFIFRRKINLYRTSRVLKCWLQLMAHRSPLRGRVL